MTELLLIESKDNQYIKAVRSLSAKKARKDQQAFLVEGIRLAEEAVAVLADIRCCLFDDSSLSGVRGAALAETCLQRGLLCYRIPDRLMGQISQTEHSQGVVLIVGLPNPEIAGQKLTELSDSFVIVLDRVADPGNVGTIIRTAHAAGAGGVLLNPGCADLYNPKTIRATMGAVFKMPIFSADSDEQILSLLQQLDMKICVAAAGKTDLFSATELDQPLAWIMGSEAHGVSSFWQQAADICIGLPMVANAESLNVASAAAVLIYETARQRSLR